MGAIIGAGYAAGMSGLDIHHYATAMFRKRTEVLGRLWQLRPKRMRDVFAEGASTIGQFDAVRVMETFLPPEIPRTFAELETPLKVVVTDFYGWGEMALEEGDLLPALAASAALPVVFRPVRLDGRVMVDGGVTNPLPFDQLDEDVDLVIAVDVIGGPIDRHGRTPRPTETVFGATQLFMQSIVAQKLRHPRAPDILIRPKVDVRVLDFLKAGRIIEAAEPVKDEVKRRVDEAMRTLSAPGR